MSEVEDGFLIGALLAVPYQNLMRRVQKGLEESGFEDLRPAHMPVFQHLAPEGSRVTELAERAQTTKQAMGYLVTYLEERGYLERVPDPTDRRAQIVRRTRRGWEVNRAATRLVRGIQDEWAGVLGEEGMRQLRELLGELVRHIGVQYAGSVPEAARAGR